MTTESIFGSNGPKFCYDHGGEGETFVTLGHWVTLKDEPVDEKILINESELEADRVITMLGAYWQFSGMVYLMKYGTIPEIRNKFEEIYQYNYQKVSLWKHSDGEPFKDSAGGDALFLMKVIPKNYQELDYRDVLLIDFISEKGIDFSNGLSTVPTLSEIIIKGVL